MPRKRPSAPTTGDLFDRGAYARGKATAAPRRRRAGRNASANGGSAVTTQLEPDDAESPEPPDGFEPPAFESSEEPIAPTEPFFDEPYRAFEYVGGIHLTNSILWCDADRKRDLCFLSHAHASFVGKNRRILATDKTLKVLTRKSGKVDALTSPFKRSFTLGPLHLEMHPAGHVLGSAQLLIERKDRRLVFTSDVCTRRSATVERAAPVECDALVIPATYGSPEYRFPPREEVFEKLVVFIDRCLEDHATPVLLANTIGSSQELMRLLGDAGYKMRVHGSIYEVAKLYRSLGVNLPGSRRFGGTPGRDEVVIFPPILKKHAAIRKLKKSRTAFISGRAVEPAFKVQQRVDEVFPFSDCADYVELLDFIAQTGARDVYLYGERFVEELGSELRQRGLRVFPLVEPKQLDLL